MRVDIYYGYVSVKRKKQTCVILFSERLRPPKTTEKFFSDLY